jgi:hypothetical protein
MDMPLKMKQILKYTSADRIEKSKFVKVVGLKYGVHKHTGIPMCVSNTYSPENTKNGPKYFKYVTKIEFLPKGYVKLGCSCGDFKFRAEYVLHRYGAADIMYSNGEPPKETNPSMIPMACKHCVALFHTMLAKKLIS